ncbi:MAG: hypothetical protein GWO03_15265, partial [Gammaproteobacteria bacterium]|nr:hypothetical protein [Gammaproteobacteria bacterium]
ISVTLHVATATAGAPTLSWPFALQPGQALPPITLEPPTLQLSGARVRLERHRTRLSGVASDDSGMRELLVFRNGRKVAYRPAISGSARRLPFSTTLSLRPGRNVIRLVARDADGMTTTRTLLLWQGRQDRFPLAPGPVGGA